MAIHLEIQLPAFLKPPTRTKKAKAALDLHPVGSYLALLPVGLAVPRLLPTVW
tara:strand:+ start:1910 stop:2068 length:159 start_codon:yes stop_codon:yes gene_type:complete